jgi:hypothetical protein
MTNPPKKLTDKNCGVASGFAFGYDPTGRSFFIFNGQ